MKKGRIIAAFMSGLLLMNGCSLIENDLDKLEGTWSDGEGNGVVFYAPNESEDNCGDAEMITNGNTQNASYEWHESSQQIVIEQNRYAMACASCRIAFFVFYTKNSGK